MRDDPKLEKPELVERPVEPEEPMAACDLCLTLWPADALENGTCPDCLEEDGQGRV